MILNY